MQIKSCSILTAALAAGIAGGAFGFGAEIKPKYTVKEVMRALHKGDDALCKKVSKGQGAGEDFAKLVEYYGSLPLNDPPKGDPKSWTAKTTSLLKAAKALQAGVPGALDTYREAVNCKACHSLHKPN